MKFQRFKKAIQKKKGVDINVEPFSKDTWYLTWIERQQGKKGAGADAINYLKKRADRHKKNLILLANEKKLKSYYRKLGFSKDREKSGDEYVMKRKPLPKSVNESDKSTLFQRIKAYFNKPKSNISKYEPIFDKPAPPYPRYEGNNFIDEHLHHLTHTLGYPEFDIHFNRLKADKRMTREKLITLHNKWHEGTAHKMPKSATKQRVLKSIADRNRSLRTFKAKADASAGRSAA